MNNNKINIMVNLDSFIFEKMLKESKPILFFKKIGKLFPKCENLYIFEKGSQYKIIGKCQLGKIHFIEQSQIGTSGMLPFYVKHILKNELLFEQIQKVYQVKLENYDNSIKLDFLYYLEGLKKLQNNEDFSFFSLSQNELRNHLEKQELSKKLVRDCDTWLKEIGYYDDSDTTQYHFFVECDNLEKVNLTLSDFSKDSVPKGWYYCERL